MHSLRCKYCGSQISANDSVCSMCGAAQTGQTMAFPKKTLFCEEAELHQLWEERAKAGALKKNLAAIGYHFIRILGLTALGVVATLLCGIGFILLIGAALYALGIAGFAVYAFFKVFGSIKTVVCPKCNAQNRIYSKVAKYMCNSCRSLLLAGENSVPVARLKACPYCSLQTAVAGDYGRYLCPDCGIICRPGDDRMPEESRECSRCQTSLPTAAIYCMTCGHIEISDFSSPLNGEDRFAYDMDWKIGKSPFGHLQFARAVLKEIRKGTSARQVKNIQPLFEMIREALVSLEEAMQHPSVRHSVETIISELDMTYASVLDAALQSIQSAGDKKFEKDELKIFENEPHIPARKRIEEALGGSLQSLGSIGLWQEKLVIVKTGSEYDNYLKKSVSYSEVKSFDILKQEAARFAFWKESRQIPAAPAPDDSENQPIAIDSSNPLPLPASIGDNAALESETSEPAPANTRYSQGPQTMPFAPAVVAVQPNRINKKFAIASFATGIAGFFTGGLCLIGSIAGLVVGIIAVKKVNAEPYRFGGKGIAKAGIATNSLALLGGAAIIVVLTVDGLKQARMRMDAEPAVVGLRDLSLAQRKFFSANQRYGHEDELMSAGYISPGWNEKDEYRFELKVTADSFEATAIPFGKDAHLLKSYYISSDHIIRAASANEAQSSAGDPPFSVSGYDTPRKFTPRVGAAGTIAADRIYVLGGTKKSSALNTVQEYDAQTERWFNRADMPSERIGHCAVSIAGLVYVLGGRDKNDVLSSVEVYDPALDKWTTKEVNLMPRWQHSIIAVGSKMYIFGGITGTGNNRQITDKVEVYDTINDSVTVRSPLPHPVSGAAICILGGQIYLLGGRSGSGSDGAATNLVQKYDPETDSWGALKAMNYSRVSSAAVVLGGKIHAIGGASLGIILSTIESYDVEKDSWTIESISLKQPGASLLAFLVKDRLHIIGGSASGDEGSLLADVDIMPVSEFGK